MKKYLALYLAPVEAMRDMMAKATDADKKAGMDAWMVWAGKNKAAILDLGMPLARNKRVTASGVADMANELAGYSFVEAESHDQATAMFKDHPHMDLKGAYIEVTECVQMQGM